MSRHEVTSLNPAFPLVVPTPFLSPSTRRRSVVMWTRNAVMFIAFGFACVVSTSGAQAQDRDAFLGALGRTANKLLFCAHPTAEYGDVTLEDFGVNGSRVTAKFTISYVVAASRSSRRSTSIRLQVSFRDGKFISYGIIEDGSFTNAEVGLSVCPGVWNVLASASARSGGPQPAHPNPSAQQGVAPAPGRNGCKDGTYYVDISEHDDEKCGPLRQCFVGCVTKAGARAGHITGHGKFFFRSGDRYEGDLVAGKRHGRGTYRWLCGASYRGEYRNDERSGLGTFTWPDGTYYSGQYRAGLPVDDTFSEFCTRNAGLCAGTLLVAIGLGAAALSNADESVRSSVPAPTWRLDSGPSSNVKNLCASQGEACRAYCVGMSDESFTGGYLRSAKSRCESQCSAAVYNCEQAIR